MLSKEKKIHKLFILSYSEIADKLSGQCFGRYICRRWAEGLVPR